jgi:external thioesterase TEII
MSQITQIIKRGTGPQQLICFPFLGGYAASYYPLASSLPETIEVVAINPPGHGACQKPPLQSMEEMVDLYYCSLKSVLKRHCIFFGHSMGAIVAFFLAHRVINSAECPVKPSALMISAVDSPDFFSRLHMTSESDETILKYLISIGGIPEELQAETALMKFFAPVFRADFAALETALVPQPLSQLEIPARLLFGSTDRSVAPASIHKWQDYFSQGATEIRINGGHMFVMQNATDVARHIEDLFADIA